jgi:hypothetical protein
MLDVAFVPVVVEAIKCVIDLFDRGMERWNGVIAVIEDHVVLRRDVAGGEVQDHGNQRRVFRRIANKHALTRATVPFRDGLAILKIGVKHIHWASKDVSTLEISMISSSGRPKLIGSKSTECLARDAIIDPDCVMHRKGPEIELATFRPMKHEVE